MAIEITIMIVSCLAGAFSVVFGWWLGGVSFRWWHRNTKW